ncbi:MAG: hypothetical protein WKI04_14920 [Ferruginibacter sp.]
MKKIISVKELEKWMTDNCYHDSYGINGRIIHEGYGLENAEYSWTWYYTERGGRDILARFQSEEEAVDYAFKKIIADGSANRHMIGFVKEGSQENELINELQKREIFFLERQNPLRRRQ